jgi:site-specific DNA-methyltransferase (adenine-specific)
MRALSKKAGHEYESTQQKGRWPANLILDEEAGQMLDQQTGILKSGPPVKGQNTTDQIYGQYKERSLTHHTDKGGASRFFYCAKAPVKEREAGLHEFDPINVLDGRTKPIDNPYLRGKTERRNTHTTVKPISLCRWMTRLVCPPGGTIIDPFAGSGSFGCAAALEDFNWIGIEIEDESATIAVARIEYWRQQK